MNGVTQRRYHGDGQMCVECNYCIQVYLFVILEAFSSNSSLWPAQALIHPWCALEGQSSNSNTKEAEDKCTPGVIMFA